ncbi:MAG: magnesium transporter CorA family protein [Bacillota bacterium]
MLKVYKSAPELVPAELNEAGIWVNMVNPTPFELEQVTTTLGIARHLLEAVLDNDERSHIDILQGQALIAINVPFLHETEEPDAEHNLLYDAIPLGIILSPRAVITVCLEEAPGLAKLISRRLPDVATDQHMGLVAHLLYATASQYLTHLKQMGARANELERRVLRATSNAQVVELLSMEKSLTYFRAACHANEMVIKEMQKADQTPALTELLSDLDVNRHLLDRALIENKQAIEMCEVLRDVLCSMANAFASLTSNNLNIAMRFLTSLTIVISFPTLVASIYGMNVNLPFQQWHNAFMVVMVISLLSTIGSAVYLVRKGMF